MKLIHAPFGASVCRIAKIPEMNYAELKETAPAEPIGIEYDEIRQGCDDFGQPARLTLYSPGPDELIGILWAEEEW